MRKISQEFRASVATALCALAAIVGTAPRTTPAPHFAGDRCDRPGVVRNIRRDGRNAPLLRSVAWPTGRGPTITRVSPEALLAMQKATGAVRVGPGVWLSTGERRIVFISDIHLEFDPYSPQLDTVVGGTNDPSHIVDLIYALKPDYIVAAGDQGHDSTDEEEYRGLVVEIAAPVTTAGVQTVTIDASRLNGNAYLYGDANNHLVATNTWATAYDPADPLGTRDHVKLTSLTSGTLTGNFKVHSAHWVVRAHAIAEYWPYLLVGRFFLVVGNHDVVHSGLPYCAVSPDPPNPHCTDTGIVNPSPNWQSTLAIYGPGFATFGGYQLFSSVVGIAPHTTTFGTTVPWQVWHPDPLITLIGIDSMSSLGSTVSPGGADGTGGGTAYGDPQEFSLRHFLNVPIGDAWTFPFRHFPNQASCVGAATLTWTAGEAPGLDFSGHIHGGRIVHGLNFLGSMVRYFVDVSGYTYMAHAIHTGGGADCTVLNPGMTEDWNDGAATMRTFAYVTLTAHTLKLEMKRDTTGATVYTLNLTK